jgi:hypothetical protein
MVLYGTRSLLVCLVRRNRRIKQARIVSVSRKDTDRTGERKHEEKKERKKANQRAA